MDGRLTKNLLLALLWSPPTLKRSICVVGSSTFIYMELPFFFWFVFNYLFIGIIWIMTSLLPSNQPPNICEASRKLFQACQHFCGCFLVGFFHGCVQVAGWQSWRVTSLFSILPRGFRIAYKQDMRWLPDLPSFCLRAVMKIMRTTRSSTAVCSTAWPLTKFVLQGSIKKKNERGDRRPEEPR